MNVKQIVEKHKLKIYDTDCVTDLIALPWLVAIVNPEEIGSEELEGLLGILDEFDGDFCVIFSTHPCVYSRECQKAYDCMGIS